MDGVCIEHKEKVCRSYPMCYGCNAFKNSTNFDRIKSKILKMNISEFIEYCGGDSCTNIICQEISKEHWHCKNGKTHSCEMCIKEYLENITD